MCTLANLTCDVERTAVAFDYLLADRQPESCAFPRRFGSYEQLKHTREHFWRDACPGVHDFDDDSGPCSIRRTADPSVDRDHALMVYCVHCIIEQIEQDSLQGGT